MNTMEDMGKRSPQKEAAKKTIEETPEHEDLVPFVSAAGKILNLSLYGYDRKRTEEIKKELQRLRKINNPHGQAVLDNALIESQEELEEEKKEHRKMWREKTSLSDDMQEMFGEVAPKMVKMPESLKEYKNTATKIRNSRGRSTISDKELFQSLKKELERLRAIKNDAGNIMLNDALAYMRAYEMMNAYSAYEEGSPENENEQEREQREARLKKIAVSQTDSTMMDAFGEKGE